MNRPTSTEPLSRLIELRQREIDRRSAELAEKLRLRERYQRNLAQLDALGSLCTLEPAHKARLQAPRQQAGALAGLALNSGNANNMSGPCVNKRARTTSPPRSGCAGAPHEDRMPQRQSAVPHRGASPLAPVDFIFYCCRSPIPEVHPSNPEPRSLT